MNLVIVEDEPFAAERLEKMLKKWLPEGTVKAVLPSIEESVEWFNSNEPPDLVFLDIQLADGISFRIFEQVKLSVPVIFTTAYDAYALKAFELQSVDYLLKPIKEDKLEEALDKFRKMKRNFAWQEMGQELNRIMQSNASPSTVHKKRFLITKGDRLISVAASDVACFIAEDKAVMLLTGDGLTYFIPHSLDELEAMVHPEDFFRISRQHIISRRHIVTVNQHFNYRLKVEMAPQCDQEFMVSKSRVQEFKAWYGG